jgi:alpha-L-arabinofuranosidase
MFFNASGKDRFLFCNYGAAGNAFSAIQDRSAPECCAFKGGASTKGAIEKARWYDIALTVGRDKAEMFLDRKKVSDARAEHLPSFFATAGYEAKSGTVAIKATNYHAQPIRAEIQLDGATRVAPAGRHVIISSAGRYDDNTLDDPRRIVPREQPLRGCAPRFSVMLPPLSVNVLRIPAERPAGAAQTQAPQGR